MRFEVVFVSLIALLLGSITFAIGIVCLFYPHASALLFSFFDAPMRVGIFLVIVALSLFAAFFGLCRKRYLRCKMGGYAISQSVIAQFAKKSLSELFPNKEIACDVLVRKGKEVEITAHLPDVEEREGLLEAVEARLVEMLTHKCGFSNTFLCHIHFTQRKST